MYSSRYRQKTDICNTETVVDRQKIENVLSRQSIVKVVNNNKNRLW